MLKTQHKSWHGAFCRWRTPAALYRTMLDGGQYKEPTNWLRWFVDRPPFGQISAAKLRSSNQYLHLTTLAHREPECKVRRVGISEEGRKEGRSEQESRVGRGDGVKDDGRRRGHGENMKMWNGGTTWLGTWLEIGGKLN